MIPKSGNRFSGLIMRKIKERDRDPVWMKRIAV